VTHDRGVGQQEERLGDQGGEGRNRQPGDLPVLAAEPVARVGDRSTAVGPTGAPSGHEDPPTRRGLFLLHIGGMSSPQVTAGSAVGS
jgi:hypothetical protein